MSPSEVLDKRELLVETETPGVEIFCIDPEGRVVARGIRNLKEVLPLALYKIRYRIGDRVTDTLIELPQGQGPFRVDVPTQQLPIVSAAPAVANPGEPFNQAAEFERTLLSGSRAACGSGASLFLFVSPDHPPNYPTPGNPGVGLSIRQFTGELVVDMANVQNQSGCVGSNIDLNPGCYLLHSEIDAGPAVEQTIVVAQGWQTRVYIRMVENGSPPSESSAATTQDATPGWKFDLPQLGVIMVRDDPWAEPSAEDARWTAAARAALAVGRSEAAPNRDMMRALLRGKFQNPMLGIYAGHLLALQPKPDRALLYEVYTNLSDLIGPHPDVEALLIAVDDPKARELAYPEPPMLCASWSLVLRASTRHHDLRPERSYSARISASLWGSGAWLSWRSPPPLEVATTQPSPKLLYALVDEARTGRLQLRLEDLAKQNAEALSPTERLLASQLAALGRRLQLANELSADRDSTSFYGSRYILPLVRRFVDSDLQKQAKEEMTGELNAEKLSDWSGIPYSTVVEAASTLGNKLGLATSSTGRRILGRSADSE